MMNRFLADETGSAAVEYVVMTGLFALLGIAFFQSADPALRTAAGTVNTAIISKMP